VQACATYATGASGSCGSTTPTGTSSLLNCIQQVARSSIAFSNCGGVVDTFSTSADGFAIETNRSIRYVPLQSESGRKLLQRSGRSPDDISSVVLVEKERWPP